MPILIAVGIDLHSNWKHHLDTFAGVKRYAQQRRWQLAVHPRLQCNSSPLRQQRPSGIVARASPELSEIAQQRNLPLVNIWVNSPVDEVPTVCPDFLETGRLAAGHLLRGGWRQLAYLGFRSNRQNEPMLQGIEEVVGRGGAPLRIGLFDRQGILDGTRWAEFQEELRAWLKQSPAPMGVVTCCDLLSYHLASACAALSLCVPDEIAIVGQPDMQPLCTTAEPTLTSVRQDYEMVGFQAARLLDAQMRGESSSQTSLLVPPAALNVRCSTVRGTAADIVHAAVDFIAAHCRQAIGVDDVVARVPASRRTLERRFRDVLGRSIAEEITRQRLHWLKRQLAQTDVPICQLAYATGFANASVLYRLFRRREGISPSQYREAHRSPPAA